MELVRSPIRSRAGSPRAPVVLAFAWTAALLIALAVARQSYGLAVTLTGCLAACLAPAATLRHGSVALLVLSPLLLLPLGGEESLTNLTLPALLIPVLWVAWALVRFGAGRGIHVRDTIGGCLAALVAWEVLSVVVHWSAYPSRLDAVFAPAVLLLSVSPYWLLKTAVADLPGDAEAWLRNMARLVYPVALALAGWMSAEFAAGGAAFWKTNAVIVSLKWSQPGVFFGGLICVLGAYLLAGRPARWLQVGALPVLAMLIWGVGLAWARAWFVGLWVGACVLLYLYRRWMGLACALASVLLVALWPPARMVAEDVFTDRRLTYTLNRMMLWEAGWEAALESPAVGSGPGVAARSWGVDPSTRPGAGVRTSAHNVFLDTAGELGFPGLAILLVLLGAAFQRLRRAMRTGRGQLLGVLGMAGTAYFAALVVVSLFNEDLISIGSTATLDFLRTHIHKWALLGMVTGLMARAQRERWRGAGGSDTSLPLLVHPLPSRAKPTEPDDGNGR